MKTRNASIWTALDSLGAPSTKQYARVVACSVLALTLAGCGARQRDHVEGETHWLSTCANSETCGSGLTCVCGVCTSTCEADEHCASLNASAQCDVAGETSYWRECAPESANVAICTPKSDEGKSKDPDAAQPSSASTSGTSSTGASEPSPTGANEGTSPASASDVSSSSELLADASAAGAPCDPPITPEQRASTPREDRSAEVLAVMAGDGFVASDAEYERAQRDHAALISIDERLTTFYTDSAEPSVGDQISLQLTYPEQFEEAASCLNDAYGATFVSSEAGGTYFYSLLLQGVFNLDRVSASYTALPGVAAEPYPLSLPPAIFEDAAFARGVTRDGDVYVYSFAITKVACEVLLEVEVDGQGAAQILSWDTTYWTDSETIPSCERPDRDI